MSERPSDLLYSEEHEYLKKTGEAGVYLVGITDYAQGELGDVVYVELPSVGETFGKADVFGTVEAVKAVSDLFSPVAGEVVGINEKLADDPSVVNRDPYGEGWMIRLRVDDEAQLDTLLGAEEYGRHVNED